MARAIPEKVLNELVDEISGHPEGISLEELATANAEIPKRTLQRYVSRLVGEGKIAAVGRAASRRYGPVKPAAPGTTHAVGAKETTGAWVSPAGARLQGHVRRPLSERTPVGYRREFLDSYRPNVDQYLPDALRAQLHRLGRSPEGERPAGTYARQILDRLLIDLSWASSRLEGNTYTRLDTQNLIEFGRLAEGKDQREAQMILNHKAAVEMLVEDAGSIGFNRYTVQNLHAILADNLLSDPGAGGRVRSIPVSISGTVYQPTGIPQLIEEAFNHILLKAEAIEDPYEQAFFAMVHIPYLQPFEDVNKRVSRVAANIPLIKKNLAPLSFVDVPERDYVEAVLSVYELQRIELLRDLFAWAYERSCQRYTVLREALPSPDPLRLKYRTELGELVRDAVREGRAIDPVVLRARARPLVAVEDLESVVAMALNELYQLHEGNIVRFGLRLAEYRAWARHQVAKS